MYLSHCWVAQGTYISYHINCVILCALPTSLTKSIVPISEVIPDGIEEFVGENYSTVIQLASESDIYSGFKFRSPDISIEEDYVGSFRMSKRITSENRFQYNEDDMRGMLDCCTSAYPGLDYSLRAAWSCMCRSALNDSNLQ